MNIDNGLLFSNGQTVVTSTTAASSNSLLVGPSQGMITGIGEATEVVIALTGTVTMNGGTIAVTLYADDDNAGTHLVTVGSVTIPATAVIGDKFVIDIPANDDQGALQELSTNRYYYLNYVPASITTCTLTAWLSLDEMVQNDHIYPKSGFTVK